MTRLRRAVTVPTVLALEGILLATAPLLLMVALVVSLACRSTRPVRTVLLVLTYAAIDAPLLRLLRGEVADTDALVRRVLDRGYRAMARILDVHLQLEAGTPEPAQLDPARPLVVLARHCGPGDSLLLAWLLAVHYQRRIHVVLKRALRLEPTLDLAADHLPLCFVRPGDGRAAAGVRTLAAGLGAGDALLLFPEGGNFSRRRWRRAVLRLAREGHFRAARRALRHDHTLPPRLGGTAAALAAAPTADVLLLAHSGLGVAGRDRPWWRLPVHQPFIVRGLLVPAAQAPRAEADVARWLDEAWARVDTWVAARSELTALAATPAGEPAGGSTPPE